MFHLCFTSILRNRHYLARKYSAILISNQIDIEKSNNNEKMIRFDIYFNYDIIDVYLICNNVTM